MVPLTIYRCEACGGDFESQRSDEDAKAEAAELFQQQPETHPMAVVCDACFTAMMKAKAEHVEMAEILTGLIASFGIPHVKVF